VAPVDAATLATFLPAWQGLEGNRDGEDRLEEAILRLEGLALPWSELSQAILPQRAPGFTAERLDLLCAAGRIVWVGRGPAGPRDGRVALYRRARVAALLPVPTPPWDASPPGPLHEALLGQMERRGASFLVELEAAAARACPGATAEEFRAALWDLVWAGRITNDTFAPLRSLGRVEASSVRSRRRRRGRDSLAGGRWSLVQELLDPAVTETEQALARATMLLERYGIVSREAALAEELPGGFGSLYRTLRALEEAGRVRRGYFVEGLSGAQFALPGAVDRLRAARSEALGEQLPVTADVRVLPTLDPANPYGALLPWPETNAPDPARPRRAAGAWVVLVAGRPALYVAPGGRHLLTFAGAFREQVPLDRAFRALRLLPRPRRRPLTVEKIDGVPVRESPYGERMLRCGFENDYRGVTLAPEPEGRSSMRAGDQGDD
jgi:ATP-dependent Lhr-like helicase